MDQRQQKTRDAVFAAFSRLLSQKSYHKITVQEIIDAANIGRTTFYAHFETKEDLLRALCGALFQHIIDSAMDAAHTHGRYSDKNAPGSAFLHLFQHLAENDGNILELLSCESNGLFLRYFKESLNGLIRVRHPGLMQVEQNALPADFKINFVSSTFVETVLWWLKNQRQQTPEELAGYFMAVTAPIWEK